MSDKNPEPRQTMESLKHGENLCRSAAQTAEEEKAGIISLITHDIKGPLTVIQGYVEIMLEEGPGKETAERLTEIRRSADRIAGMINDMLTLSRMESGTARLSLKPVSLPDLLSQAVRDNLTSATRKGVSIELEVDGPLPALHADEAHLGRALTNLVANAVNYNRPAGKVWVRAGRQADSPDKVVVEVSDTGMGIADEDLPHLFKKHYRGRMDGLVRGTGLGLAVVKSVAEAHGGKAYASNREGEGVTFGIALPLHPHEKGGV